MSGTEIEKIMTYHCRHFTGRQNESCEAGIHYDRIGHPLPCLQNVAGPSTCPLHEWHTLAEVEAKEAATVQAVAKFFSDLTSDICPHCGAAIEKKVQIGRCVYAEPCGDRLYQGKLKAKGFSKL